MGPGFEVSPARPLGALVVRGISTHHELCRRPTWQGRGVVVTGADLGTRPIGLDSRPFPTGIPTLPVFNVISCGQGQQCVTPHPARGPGPGEASRVPGASQGPASRAAARGPWGPMWAPRGELGAWPRISLGTLSVEGSSTSRPWKDGAGRDPAECPHVPGWWSFGAVLPCLSGDRLRVGPQ